MQGSNQKSKLTNLTKKGNGTVTVSRLSWDLQDPQGVYDPNERYTQSTDKKGHSAWIKTRVPTQIAAEIARVVQTGKIPEYNSAQDLVRDAIIHHLNSLSEYLADPNLERIVTLTVLYDQTMKEANDREMFTDYMRALEDQLTHLINKGMKHEVKRVVTQVRESIDAVPPSLQAELTTLLDAKLDLV